MLNIYESNSELVKGIRIKNTSVKIYKRDDGQFLVICKKYLWKFRITSKLIVTSTFEEAEDYFISAKFEGQSAYMVK